MLRSSAPKSAPDDGAPRHARQPHAFNSLPTLEFNSSLDLVFCNEAARRVFPGISDDYQPRVGWFLQQDADAESSRSREGLQACVAGAAGTSEQAGQHLEFWSGPKGQRQPLHYQVVVERTRADGFAILLIQPSPSPSIVPSQRPPSSASTTSLYAAPSSASSGSKRRNSMILSQADRPSYEPIPKAITAGMPASQRPKINEDAPTRALEDILSKVVVPPSETTKATDEETRTPPECKDLTSEEAEHMLEALPVMCFEASALGHTSWFNGEWYRYTGLSPADSFNYERWASLFHPDDLVYVLPLWTESMRTGEIFRFEYRVKNAEGRYRWHVCQGRPYRDSEGKILSWACSVTDVEELVQARSAATQVREHIRAVMAGANLTLLAIDKAGIVTFFEGSQSSARSYGRPGSSDINQPIICGETALAEVWPDERLQAGMKRVLGGRDPSWTDVLDYGDGAQHVRYRVVPLLGGPGAPDDEMTGLIVVGANITETIKTEEALHQAYKDQADLKASESAANEASRLKTAFLTMISHEIRTPIAGILGICELLENDPSLSDGHRSLVDKAMRSGENLLDLVGMVLDVRKIEVGELTIEEAPFELEQAIADARLFSIHAHRKNLNFVEDIGRFYEATVLGDRLRLRQILSNALSNSIKFTANGAIILRVRQEKETEDQIFVLFEVEDTGCGIQEHVLPTLFQPFRQADASTARQYGGTGLGLVITKNLVELMGGTIKLTSTFGKGTTMTVRVPFKKAPFANGADISRSSTPALDLSGRDGRPNREDVRILLAEDNDLIREIVTKLIRNMKFQVDAVEDGAAAVAAANSKRYDIILMDGQMPGLDGYEATAQLRQSSDPAIRDLRIIALTASAIQGDKERCLEAGMDGYLAKPVRTKDLEAAIWEQLAARNLA
ncbi:hypothetical protein BCR35DRAFT_350593 [Leucosporidium creatinivorum]|uniref:Histidine kinase n=1 Tax=Leucosporidium creatinivorum TaxID=106004 RepID=A0A1Y2FYF6_9BASI|nr:hypothetical protein BCR35DRAFT_350593 [Leucosporidium creatinivorum]